jgi:sigma-B regulation protein RsbU (phosphoserine phosphatase)
MLTAFYAVLDTRTGEMAYTNAGHEPPLLKDRDGNLEYLTMGGPMFIGMGERVYLEGSIELETGELFVLVTDGVTESRKVGTSELFGTEGIVRSLSENAGASAEEIATVILEDALSFAGGARRDDVAIVVIRKLNDAEQGIVQDLDSSES